MFLKLGDHRRSVPALALVPNLLTTLALCCGLASLHFSLMGQWEKALAAIVLSGIFDVLDGAAARLLRVSSGFGAVLDSLSDFLAFGVAPAMILQQWILKPQTNRVIDTLGLVAVMTFAVCAALRLARFTSALSVPTPAGPSSQAGAQSGAPSSASKKPSLFFVGMPTPAGAGCALLPAFIIASGRFPDVKIPETAIAIYTTVIALLMVSRVPMFALKGVRVGRRWTAPIMVLVVVLAALMLREPWLVLAGLAGFYLVTIPWSWALQRRGKVKESRPPTTG
jgi:CDP-diacylglycerol---serine O-phosphatidyltransferase